MGSLEARPSLGPAEHKGLEPLLHLESIVMEGSVRSELRVRWDLNLEEKARGISGNRMGK